MLKSDSKNSSPLPLKLLSRIVQWLPAPFRSRFAEEILEAASRKLKEARDTGGVWKMGWCALHILVDALKSLCFEHGRIFQMNYPKLAEILPALLMVIVLGAFVGWLDLTNSEVQVAVGALLVSGFLIGLTRPRWPWACAIMLGTCVPISHVISLLIGFKPPYPHDWNTVPQAFLALIPAFLGTYTGLFARWCFSLVFTVQSTPE